eukprot:6254344-Amphidinium_carterae.1
MTADQQWNRELFNATQAPMMDTTMRPDYSEDVVIGRAIIDQYFSKARLNTKQTGRNLWVNKPEVNTPPDVREDDPSGERAEGESRQDSPSGA